MKFFCMYVETHLDINKKLESNAHSFMLYVPVVALHADDIEIFLRLLLHLQYWLSYYLAWSFC